MDNEITIGQLAKQSGLSRSTLLYYDRLGLLCPGNRTLGNYRLYDRADVERLRQICLYRKMGVPLKEIGRLLDESLQPSNGSRTQAILRHRLETLETEIESLQDQQRQIVRLLEELNSRNQAKAPATVPGRRKPAPSGKRPTGANSCPGAEAPTKNTGRRVAESGSRQATSASELFFPKNLKENDMIKKDRWVEIMRAAGFTEDDMRNWHRQFEKMEPEAHQEFMESLGIGGEEIAKIREWSRS